MAKSKAKWLAQATTRELIVMVKECIFEEEYKKANKVLDELLERTPEEDGNLTVEEAVEKVKQDLEAILEAYKQEVASVITEESKEEEDEEEVKKPTEKPTEKPAKSSKRRSKKAKVEEEPEESDEDEEEAGYEDMSQGELKKELRRRGIKVTKSMKKADMVRALEADDEE